MTSKKQQPPPVEPMEDADESLEDTDRIEADVFHEYGKALRELAGEAQ